MSKALTRRRTTGGTTVRSPRGRKPSKLAPFYAAIRERVAERGDTTIEELRAWLLKARRSQQALGYSLAYSEAAWADAEKKSLRAAEQDPVGHRQGPRAEWRESQPAA